MKTRDEGREWARGFKALTPEQEAAQRLAMGRVRSEAAREKKIGGAMPRQIEELEAALRVSLDLATDRPAIPIKGRPSQATREACAVFVASDWHVEERVLPSHVNGLNEYGPDVARKRAERFVEGCLWLLDTHRGGAKIETAVLALLGDFITGWIHEEYQAGNALAPTEATEFAHDLLRDCIEAILKRARLKALRIVCTRGNHGRITKRTYINAAARLSFEWLMFRMLAKH